MKDQADKLRQIIENLKSRQTSHSEEQKTENHNNSARVITVTSGKGGVGKTNVTVNLAVALSELGLRVVILDADFGLANIDVLFGIIPQYSLVDVIHNQKSILEVLSKGPKDIKFLSGGSGVEELVKMDKEQMETFLNNIGVLDNICDIILIDTGAGLSDSVMKFVMASDEVLLVTTPEPTSITDAYALVKMISNRNREKVVKVLVNRAEDEKEARDVLNRLTMVSEKFLGLKIRSLGYLLRDDMVIKAVKLQQPFTICYPKSQASKAIASIARGLLDIDDRSSSKEETGARSFMSRLASFFH